MPAMVPPVRWVMAATNSFTTGSLGVTMAVTKGAVAKASYQVRTLLVARSVYSTSLTPRRLDVRAEDLLLYVAGLVAPADFGFEGGGGLVGELGDVEGICG